MIVKLDYLYEYVPKKCVGDHEILEKFKIIRENIWYFKDGKTEGQEYFIHDVISTIEKIKLSNKDKRVVIVPIPASNDSKTYTRFYNFLKKVCEKTGIVNGYEAIKSEAHEAAHLGGPRTHNFTRNTSFEILENDIIIIFDDVWTSGASFKKASDLSIFDEVYGLFLGKTIDRFNSSNYIDLEKIIGKFL